MEMCTVQKTSITMNNKKVYEPEEINRVLLQFVFVIYIFFKNMKNCLIMWPYVELIADVWCGLEE